MKSTTLNEYLNVDNAWLNRLFGFTPFKVERSIEKVEKEYNIDKYGMLRKLNPITIDQAKIQEFELGGLRQDSIITISLGDELFSVELMNARRILYSIIKSKVESLKSKCFCELGCGYGYNLSYLDGLTQGGEYSENAVKLGKSLGLNISQFNYYKPQDYDFITENTTVFTVHSLEQIPDATCFLNNIKKQREKIDYVVHFEPTVLENRKNLLGVLRNRYMGINDYNKNLYQLLEKDNDIEVLEFKQDIYGLNPLNSANLIVWKFIK